MIALEKSLPILLLRQWMITPLKWLEVDKRWVYRRIHLWWSSLMPGISASLKRISKYVYNRKDQWQSNHLIVLNENYVNGCMLSCEFQINAFFRIFCFVVLIKIFFFLNHDLHKKKKGIQKAYASTILGISIKI